MTTAFSLAPLDRPGAVAAAKPQKAQTLQKAAAATLQGLLYALRLRSGGWTLLLLERQVQIAQVAAGFHQHQRAFIQHHDRGAFARHVDGALWAWPSCRHR